MGKFLGYIRVSDTRGREETLLSPDLQEQAISRWAAANDHDVTFLEHELDQSGTDDRRPILLGAIDAIERGDFDGLAVWRLDRFARSVVSGARFIEQVEAAGGTVESATQSFGDNPDGRMVRNITLSIAQGEHERLKEGLARAREDAVMRRGIHISSRPPFGYRRREDTVLEPDPDTAPIVRDMFRRRAAGESWRDIAKVVAKAVGHPYAPQSIQRMVTNRVYTGEARNGPYVKPGAHEALVDRATFEAAQLGHPRPPRGSNGPALLSGLIRCEGCGHAMVPTTRSGARAYRCRRHHADGACPAPAHAGQWIEPHVEALILDKLRAHVEPKPRTDDVERAERAFDDAEAELKAFQEATSASGVGAEHFASGLRSRVEAVKEASAALGRTRTGPAPTHADALDVWDELSVEDRRAVLARVGVVYVRKGSGPAPSRVRLVPVTD